MTLIEFADKHADGLGILCGVLMLMAFSALAIVAMIEASKK